MRQKFKACNYVSGVLILFLLLAGCIMPSSVFSSTIFLGIGNDGYFNDVKGLHKAVSSELSPYGGFSAYMLQNQEGSAILDAIMDLKSSFHSGDTLIWFYSGHSRRVKDVDHDETGASSWAETRYDEAIGIRYHSDRATDDQLADAFASIAREDASIITIFDTCYAGGFVGGEKDLNSIPGGVTFLASSKEDEDSWSIDGQPYSIFTQSLINAISDASDHYKGNGTMIVDDLFRHVMGYIELSDLPGYISQTPYGWDLSMPVSRPLPIPLPGTLGLLSIGLGLLKLLRYAFFRH